MLFHTWKYAENKLGISSQILYLFALDIDQICSNSINVYGNVKAWMRSSQKLNIESKPVKTSSYKIFFYDYIVAIYLLNYVSDS